MDVSNKMVSVYNCLTNKDMIHIKDTIFKNKDSVSTTRPIRRQVKAMGSQKEAIKMAIKDEILGHFRETHANRGDVLSVSWLYDDFLPSLSDKENQAMEEVIAEMIHDGLLEYIDGPKATYALTKKGKRMMC